jgi:hypothetical protein
MPASGDLAAEAILHLPSRMFSSDGFSSGSRVFAISHVFGTALSRAKDVPAGKPALPMAGWKAGAPSGLQPHPQSPMRPSPMLKIPVKGCKPAIHGALDITLLEGIVMLRVDMPLSIRILQAAPVMGCVERLH